MVGFPLLLIPIAIFNIVVFLMPGLRIEDAIFSVKLLSGETWPVTGGDILIAMGALLLLIEVMKGAKPGIKYLTDHLLSLLVAGGAAAEFLLWPKFATSTFFLLTLLAAVDFLAGLALRTRRQRAPRAGRTADVASAPAADAPARVEPTLSQGPQPEPLDLTPAEAKPTAPGEVTSAASIAESVLMERPGPKPAQTAPAR